LTTLAPAKMSESAGKGGALEPVQLPASDQLVLTWFPESVPVQVSVPAEAICANRETAIAKNAVQTDAKKKLREEAFMLFFSGYWEQI
jgi:hypothetical protein